jgi:hypothetical protein
MNFLFRAYILVSRPYELNRQLSSLPMALICVPCVLTSCEKLLFFLWVLGLAAKTNYSSLSIENTTAPAIVSSIIHPLGQPSSFCLLLPTLTRGCIVHNTIFQGTHKSSIWFPNLLIRSPPSKSIPFVLN